MFTTNNVRFSFFASFLFRAFYSFFSFVFMFNNYLCHSETRFSPPDQLRFERRLLVVLSRFFSFSLPEQIVRYMYVLYWLRVLMCIFTYPLIYDLISGFILRLLVDYYISSCLVGYQICTTHKKEEEANKLVINVARVAKIKYDYDAMNPYNMLSGSLFM